MSLKSYWRSCRRIAVGCLLFAGLLVGCCNQADPGVRPLIADIAITRSHIIVKNGNQFIWEDVKISINDQFNYKMNMVPRGNSAFPFEAFVNSEGVNYNPGLLSVRKIHITVSHAGGDITGEFTW